MTANRRSSNKSKSMHALWLSLLFVAVDAQTVETALSCIPRGSTFPVFFSGALRYDDWIALVPASKLDANSLKFVGSDVESWVWKCGQFGACDDVNGSTMLASTSTTPMGSYVAVLARNVNLPSHQGLAVSSPFSIASRCGSHSATSSSVSPVSIAGDKLSPPFPPVAPLSITLTDDTFRMGDPIVVSFDNHADALPDDFFGVYPEETPTSQLQQGLLWKYLCDRQSGPCARPLVNGQVSLHGATAAWSGSNSTLVPGSYIVYLLRSVVSNGAWVVAGKSKTFVVVGRVQESREASRPSPLQNNELNRLARTKIRQARGEIAQLIRHDHDLAPKFLRLIFHDCIGGCDGCVDLTDSENRGLEKPIDALEPIFQRHRGPISRADIWALAATVGTDVTQDPNVRIRFPFQWWGRVDCTEKSECRDRNNELVPCTPKRGSHHAHPTIHINTENLYHFFQTEFDFNVRETIVAMGAHTIGSMSPENSGIHGPNGWDVTNKVFDSVYFLELIGGNSPNANMRELIDDAPRWRSVIEPVTNRRIWDGFPQPDFQRIVMLNVDIALFRNLHAGNYIESTGESMCAFEDEMAVTAAVPRCPALEQAVRIGAEFKHDSRKFLREFRAVLKRMASNGYRRPVCSSRACKLAINTGE